MKSITEANVNDAFTSGMLHLKACGEREETRGGPVLAAPTPVCTTYLYPCERVLFNPLRDANPFFHLMESLWMLAGHNDVAFVSQFNKGMKKYSDDDQVYHGAYGYRWRYFFNKDQIKEVAALLKVDPTTRRAVIGMWSPEADLNTESLDIPCNTHIYFDIRGGALNMTVCCRSNDAVWGAYGANAVHMSMLQEVVAGLVERPVGVYRQFSNNLHTYLNAPRVPELLEFPYGDDPYALRTVTPYPVVRNPETWLEECEAFVSGEGNIMEFKNPFFLHVAYPMVILWNTRDLSWLNDIRASDWQLACKEWLERRVK